MSNLYDILEICLQEIDNGADVDTVLIRYPEFADELRPILETSTQAKMLAAADPSPEIVRRSRSKVMQQAAQMRESQAGPARRSWSVPLRRAIVSLAVIAVLFMSSTRLVQAASTTLPGDNLYPVKRTWEDVRILFAFNNQEREALEIEHENERLDELNSLFAEGRSAEVDFAGTVMSQNGDLWQVAKVPVLISAKTEMSAQLPVVGDAVRVRGFTQSGGTVLAERVDLLPAGIPLPDVDDDYAPAIGRETPEGEQQQPNSGEDHSGEKAGEEAPRPEATRFSQGEDKPREFSQSGVVDSVDGNTLVVNGQSLNISGAEVKGTPKTGAQVKVEGYFDAGGVFVVTKVEFQSSGSESGDSVSDSSDGVQEDSSSKDSGDNHEDSNNDSSSGDGGSNDGSGDDGGSDAGHD